MNSSNVSDKVRDFELTTDDAARLARCFNSFDDSDSWPGGFTHGTLFTAKTIMERYSKSKNIRVLVAYDDDLIVGHCNLARAELDPNAGYVGLLGVDPAYQGRGYGKALLIEATETFARMGLYRLDLHTWGGNLKAVPLYKRMGFNWVPKSSVLMESYIPGIITCDLFKEFFNRYYWYDSMSRVITQAPDDLTENGIGVYEYRFEGKNGDALRVLIDREAKGICSFSLTLDGKTISASVIPAIHHGFIGADPISFEFTLHNKTPSTIEYSLTLTPTEKMLADSRTTENGVVASNESAKIQFDFRIAPDTVQLVRDLDSESKVSTRIEWRLVIDNAEIIMHSGVIPLDAISFTCPVQLATMTPGQSKTIPLGVQNNLPNPVRIDIRLFAEGHPEINNHVMLELDRDGMMKVPIRLKAGSDERLIPVTIQPSLSKDGGATILPEKTFNVAVVGAGTTMVRRTLTGKIALENNHLRILMDPGPPFSVTDFFHDRLWTHLNGWSLMPSIGYPFPSDGSEWEYKEFETTLTNADDYSMVQLRAASDERPGLFLTMQFKVSAHSEFLDVSAVLENAGDKQYTNLGIRLDGWMDVTFEELFVPLQHGVYRLSSVDWSGYRQLPKNPKYYAESWIALRNSNSQLFGIIWDTKRLAEVRPSRTGLRIPAEYRIQHLDPHTTVRITLARLILTQGHWSMIRDAWARLCGGEPMTPDGPVHSDLEIELVPTKSHEYRPAFSPVLVDAACENKMELHVRVIHETPISGTISITLPDGVYANGSRSLKVKIQDASIENAFVQPISITAEPGNWFRGGGRLDINLAGRIEHLPFAVIVYDSNVTPSLTESVQETSHLLTLQLGDYRIAASPEHAGSLVRYGRIDAPSLFLDTFPEIRPFIWWGQFLSGLFPDLRTFGQEESLGAILKENWTTRPINNGPWYGLESVVVIQHMANLRNITLRLRFLLLAGTPLLCAQAIVENTTPLPRECSFGFRACLRINERPQCITHTMRCGEPITLLPKESSSNAILFSKWAVFEDPASRTYLGVVIPDISRSAMYLSDYGVNGVTTLFEKSKVLVDNESDVHTIYFALLNNVDDVKLLLGLNSK